MKYEETFVAFIDFLGFSEASKGLDDKTRLKVLALLTALVDLRSEFSAAATRETDGSSRYWIKPAISTFSDHIVISFGLETLRETAGTDDNRMMAFLVYPQFQNLLTIIAAQALRIGFLIRGGATVGKLYHARGVVFGEALVEATQLEARTAVYPRVVLSATAARQLDEHSHYAKRDTDGIYCIDYISSMAYRASPPGDDWARGVKQWFDEVVVVVKAALVDHEQNGRLNELAKWTWFAKRFREAIAALPPEAVKSWGVSLADVPWE